MDWPWSKLCQMVDTNMLEYFWTKFFSTAVDSVFEYFVHMDLEHADTINKKRYIALGPESKTVGK